jgi:hypothetical protein
VVETNGVCDMLSELITTRAVPGNFMTSRRSVTEAKTSVLGLSRSADVAAFLRAANAPVANGRLIFALDATMSRQPTWDMACSLQVAMFDAVRDVGRLSVRLAYFRGTSEAKASRWVNDPAQLATLMDRIACAGGLTQLHRLLSLATRDAREGNLKALVYVGDAMEEDAEVLCAKAGELALHGVRAFMFHEGRDARAEAAFREIAAITGGVYRRFDAGAAPTLRALLKAVAVYAAGGIEALKAESSHQARAMLADLR